MQSAALYLQLGPRVVVGRFTKSREFFKPVHQPPPTTIFAPVQYSRRILPGRVSRLRLVSPRAHVRSLSPAQCRVLSKDALLLYPLVQVRRGNGLARRSRWD